MVAHSPLVLYVDDEPNNLELLKMQFGDVCRLSVARSAEEALTALAQEDVWVLLADERMPGMSGIDLLANVVKSWPDTRRVILSAYSDADRLLRAINHGQAHEYMLKPWDKQKLGECIQRNIEIASSNRTLAAQVRVADLQVQDAARGYDTSHIIGAKGGLKSVLAKARRAAQMDATILLVGETGTGKELVARFIHGESGRSAGPFVRITCAALTESIFERDLFGHGGTLFLDEISDLSQAMQARLLRVLKEQQHVRVVASTCQDLPELIRQGQFREDLYYMLEIPIQIPPLRDRVIDIPALLEHFLRKYGPAVGETRPISKEALAALCTYRWDGNIRRLQSMVQLALINSEGGELTAEDFSFNINFPPANVLEQVRDEEKETLRRALLQYGGNCAKAARALGLKRTTFVYRAKKHGLLP